MHSNNIPSSFRTVSFQAITTKSVVSPCGSCADFATSRCTRLTTGSCSTITTFQDTTLANYDNSLSPLGLLYNCDSEFYLEAI